MTSVAELKRGEYAQLAFSSITERIGESRKTFFSSLLGHGSTVIENAQFYFEIANGDLVPVSPFALN
jgi:hypothetical protein